MHVADVEMFATAAKNVNNDIGKSTKRSVVSDKANTLFISTSSITSIVT